MTREQGTLSVRADHGAWATGWRLVVAGVVRTLGVRRRRVLRIVLAVLAAAFVAAVVVGLVRRLQSPVVTVLVLLAVGVVVVFLVVALALVLWTLADRRRVAASDVDPDRLVRVREMIQSGRASLLDGADRRAVSRFARVQQLALPATVLLHLVSGVVFVVVAVVEGIAVAGGVSDGVGGVVVVVIAVLMLALNVGTVATTVRDLGRTPELVALDEP